MGKARRLKNDKRYFRESEGKISHGLSEALQNAARINKTMFFKLRDRLMPEVRHVAEQLEDYPAGPDRARGIHEHIDEAMKKEFADNKHAEKITCKKGCSYCCHLIVGVTSDEADLLAGLVKDGLEIDRSLLGLQAGWPEVAGHWYVQKPSENKCVFLSDSGACRVYENRPAACRLYTSVEDPKSCDATTGSVAHMKAVSLDGEVLYSAALTVSKPGFLPRMLKERLEVL